MIPNWTEEQIKTLIEMKLDGRMSPEISAATGKSVEQIVKAWYTIRKLDPKLRSLPKLNGRNMRGKGNPAFVGRKRVVPTLPEGIVYTDERGRKVTKYAPGYALGVTPQPSAKAR